MKKGENPGENPSTELVRFFLSSTIDLGTLTKEQIKTLYHEVEKKGGSDNLSLDDRITLSAMGFGQVLGPKDGLEFAQLHEQFGAHNSGNFSSQDLERYDELREKYQNNLE